MISNERFLVLPKNGGFARDLFWNYKQLFIENRLRAERDFYEYATLLWDKFSYRRWSADWSTDKWSVYSTWKKNTF